MSTRTTNSSTNGTSNRRSAGPISSSQPPPSSCSARTTPSSPSARVVADAVEQLEVVVRPGRRARHLAARHRELEPAQPLDRRAIRHAREADQQSIAERSRRGHLDAPPGGRRAQPSRPARSAPRRRSRISTTTSPARPCGRTTLPTMTMSGSPRFIAIAVRRTPTPLDGVQGMVSTMPAATQLLVFQNVDPVADAVLAAPRFEQRAQRADRPCPGGRSPCRGRRRRRASRSARHRECRARRSRPLAIVHQETDGVAQLVVAARSSSSYDAASAGAAAAA